VKKTIVFLLIIFSLIQLLTLSPTALSAEFSQELYQNLANNVNKVPHINILDYERVKLDNGMIVYLAEDHQLPFVQLFGYIKGGISQETSDIAGISSFMANLMNTGTHNYSEQELVLHKDINGLDFGISSRNDYYWFYGNSLVSDKENLLTLAAEVLRNPKFDADYFQRLQYLLYQDYQQMKMQDNYRTILTFYKNLYDKHPYGYSYDADLLSNNLQIFTPEMLTNYYQSNILPNKTILAVIGDIDISTMKEIIKNSFSDWQEEEIKLKKPKAEKGEKNYGRVILVDKPDATQARIKMGYLFFDNSFIDRVSYGIANEVFGGGDFESRLMKKLRSELGYVYGIGSGVYYGGLAGDYSIDTNVRPEKTFETINSIKNIIIDIKERKDIISEKEVFEIINRRNALFPKGYQYTEDVFASVINNRELMDRSPNYINQYIEAYNNISATEVQKAFAEYTYPDRFLTVIVGKKEDILPQFQEQDVKVEVIDFN